MSSSCRTPCATTSFDAGCPHDAISVMPNARRRCPARPSQDCAPREARHELGLPEEGLLGGHGLLARAVRGASTSCSRRSPLLRAEGLDVRCAVVGDGVARPRPARRQVERLGLSRRRHARGVSRSAGPSWHRALDVFVVPRQDVDVCRTVTPLKPIEAMAVGRPGRRQRPPGARRDRPVPGHRAAGRPDDSRLWRVDFRSLLDDEPLRRSSRSAQGRAFAATRTWRAWRRGTGPLRAPWEGIVMRQRSRGLRHLADMGPPALERVDVSRLTPVGQRPPLGSVHPAAVGSPALHLGRLARPRLRRATGTPCSGGSGSSAGRSSTASCTSSSSACCSTPRAGVPNYIGFLLIGVFMFSFTGRALTGGPTVMVGRQEPHPGLLLPSRRDPPGARPPRVDLDAAGGR